jgi:hypothetical protein
MSSPINVSRFQGKVRGMTGIRGENPIPTLDEFLPVVVVENDRIEFSFAGGEFLGANGFLQTLIAAQRSFVAAVNRQASGMLAVIDDILADQPADIYAVANVLDGTDLAGVTLLSTIGLIRDTRQQIGPPSAQFSGSSIRFAQGTSAAPSGVGSGPLNRIPVANTRFTQPIVLGPSSAILVACTAVATNLTVHWVWRERPLERGLPS